MYNEYIAETNKVLFNFNNFTYGNRILSKNDISKYLIQLDKDTATKYIKQFEKNKITIRHDFEEENAENNTNVKIMVLNNDGVYEEQEDNLDTRIDNYRKEFVVKIISNNGIDKQFQTIIHSSNETNTNKQK